MAEKSKGFIAMMKEKISKKNVEDKNKKAGFQVSVPEWMNKLSGSERDAAIRVHKLNVKRRLKNKK